MINRYSSLLLACTLLNVSCAVSDAESRGINSNTESSNVKAKKSQVQVTPKPTATPEDHIAEPKCIAKPDQTKKFVFLFGGQSNASFLDQNILKQELQKKLQNGVKPENIFVVKYASLGTELAGKWKPNGTSSAAGDGKEYAAFQATIANGLSAIDKTDGKKHIAAMIWMQGESDAIVEPWAKLYEANLKLFVEDVRLTYANENLPFILGRISDNQTLCKFRSVVRKAQDDVAAKLQNVKSVPLEDVPVDSADQVHFTKPEGYKKLASIFATATADQLFPGLASGKQFCDENNQ